MIKKGQHGEPWRLNPEGDICDNEGPLEECWHNIQEERKQRAVNCVNVLDGWDIKEVEPALRYWIKYGDIDSYREVMERDPE